MDLLPIKPSSNLIKPATSASNDGGSKSQSGYINVRTGKPEKTDEVNISDEGKRLIGDDPVVDEKSFITAIKEFFLLIFRFIKKIFSFKFLAKKPKPQEIKSSEKSEIKEFLGFTRHGN